MLINLWWTFYAAVNKLLLWDAHWAPVTVAITTAVTVVVMAVVVTVAWPSEPYINYSDWWRTVCLAVGFSTACTLILRSPGATVDCLVLTEGTHWARRSARNCLTYSHIYTHDYRLHWHHLNLTILEIHLGWHLSILLVHLHLWLSILLVHLHLWLVHLAIKLIVHYWLLLHRLHLHLPWHYLLLIQRLRGLILHLNRIILMDGNSTRVTRFFLVLAGSTAATET